MENDQIISANYRHGVIATFAVAIFLPFYTFAYMPQSTHAGLAEQTIQLYNISSGNKISNVNAELIIRGAVDEDSPSVRVINHFYDPVRNIGINNGRTAKEWAVADYAGNDYTWTKAIKNYAEGREAEAYVELGHVLHLIEDMAVPAHTRNDSHIGDGASGLYTGESTFETWTDKTKNRRSLASIYKNISPAEIKRFDSLSSYFDNLANYSNKNFFSEDTISDPAYSLPQLTPTASGYAYSNDRMGNKNYKLAITKKTTDGWQFSLSAQDDTSVLSDYFDRLSKQAILTGAGVVELFFKEGEVARVNFLAEQKRKQDLEVAKAVALQKELGESSAIGFVTRGLGYVISDGIVSPIANAAQSARSTLSGGATVAASATGNAGNIAVFSTKEVAAMAAVTTEKAVTSAAAKTAEMVRSSYNATVGTVRSVISTQTNVSVSPLIVLPNPTTQTTNLPAANSNQVTADGRQAQTASAKITPTATTETTKQTAATNPAWGNAEAVSSAAMMGAVIAAVDPSVVEAGPAAVETSAPAMSVATAPTNTTHETSGGATTYYSSPAPAESCPAVVDTATIATTTEQTGANETVATTTAEEGSTFLKVEPSSAPATSTTATSTEQIIPDIATSTESIVATTTLDVDIATTTSEIATSTEPTADTATSTEPITETATSTDPLPADIATSTPPTPDPIPDPVPPPDTTAPTLIATLTPCNLRDDTEWCVATGNTITVSWSSPDTDVASYTLIRDGASEILSADTQSATFTLAPDTTHAVTIIAMDQAGNVSAPITKNIYISANPVIINEVAWGGTSASTDDEWIELYNKSEIAIPLDNFTLYSKTDNSPNLKLAGEIRPGDYYLVEAKHSNDKVESTDSPIKDIAADLWAGFGYGLNNGGENLVLMNGSTTMDEVPYCARWCNKPGDQSYERISPAADGILAASWMAGGTHVRNGLNTAGKTIYGTPKARNSANYLLNGNKSFTQNTIVKSSNSPYIIAEANINIPAGVSVTIEPGVVIKSTYITSKISVNGNLIAEGTADKPIVFTAYQDDKFGGDTDSNGICSTDDQGVITKSTTTALCPNKGTWQSVDVLRGGTASISNAVFRYGGYYDSYPSASPYRKAMLYINSDGATVTNSLFENSYSNGALVDNSTTTLRGNTFHLINRTYLSGLSATKSRLFLDGNTFSKNEIGLSTTDSYMELTNNVFTGNAWMATYISGATTGTFSGNTGEDAPGNSLVLRYAQLGNGTILGPNTIPYYLYGTVSIPAGSTVEILPGTTIKGAMYESGRLDVYGKLITSGNYPSDIIFTSDYKNGQIGSWQGITVYTGAAVLRGTTISAAKVGIAYNQTPISLENIFFTQNQTALSTYAASTTQRIKYTNVLFSGNTATSSPAGNW